ncbi:MAG TPA: hypothetical protein PKM25_01505, partial [Candidatus Ozemobacteraceae bacterium]|nr:hypothetical protein [Candidatus Ozemobacteraceae bacterium]
EASTQNHDAVSTCDATPLNTPLAALNQLIARWSKAEHGSAAAIPGLVIFRHDEPTQPTSGMYESGSCLVEQRATCISPGKYLYMIEDII